MKKISLILFLSVFFIVGYSFYISYSSKIISDNFEREKQKEYEEYLHKKEIEKLKMEKYLQEKEDINDFLSKKESGSKVKVVLRNHEKYNFFDFDKLEISNLMIQPLSILDYRYINIDEILFYNNDFEPINISSILKFKEEDFKSGAIKNYILDHECGAKFYYEIFFVLTLSINENSELFIQDIEYKEELMGFDKCGFNMDGFD